MGSGKAAMSASAWGNAPGNQFIPDGQALKARLSSGNVKRAFSAGLLHSHKPRGAPPGLNVNSAPLAAKHNVSSAAKVFDRMANTPRWNRALSNIPCAQLEASIQPENFPEPVCTSCALMRHGRRAERSSANHRCCKA
jgi:hypothetical protein